MLQGARRIGSESEKRLNRVQGCIPFGIDPSVKVRAMQTEAGEKGPREGRDVHGEQEQKFGSTKNRMFPEWECPAGKKTNSRARKKPQKTREHAATFGERRPKAS